MKVPPKTMSPEEKAIAEALASGVPDSAEKALPASVYAGRRDRFSDRLSRTFLLQAQRVHGSVERSVPAGFRTSRAVGKAVARNGSGTVAVTTNANIKKSRFRPALFVVPK